MRLISLCPSLTHSLFRLGVGAQLVGITRFCVHPSKEVALLEKVGGTKNPKIDRIIQLKPDLVFLNREENRREDWQALKAAGIPCHISHPVDVDTAMAMLRDMGEVLNKSNEAAVLLDEIYAIRKLVDATKARLAQISWAYLIWHNPYMTVNGTTYIHGLLSEVAGDNVFAKKDDAYPATSAEELAALKPDRIFLSSEPFPFKQKHLDELAALTGLPASRFQIVDGERLSWHGSMTAAGLAYAHELFATDLTLSTSI